MSYATTTEFRNNMAEYLDYIKMGNHLYVGRRKKEEFVIIPADLLDEEDILALESKHLAERVAKSRASKGRSIEEVAKSLSIEL